MGEVFYCLCILYVRFFSSVPLTFIVLLKLCNDVASPFLHIFFFSYHCFLTMVLQLETRSLTSS